MTQTFNAGLAGQYGVTAALLAEYIWQEIKQNEFHNRHCYAGRVWMRCSGLMFTAVMPYLSKSMVHTGIRRLIKGGVLVKGEFNQSRFDRTAWYAFTAFGRKMMEETEDEDYAGSAKKGRRRDYER